jgi:hypothetical protein
MKRILYISIVIAALSGSSAAQEAGRERDPFFSAGPRSVGTGTLKQDDAWGRDPFNRPFEGKTAVPQVQGSPSQGKNLTGIIYSNAVRLAIISGELYKAGSMVGDQKLAEIRERSVVLMSASGGSEEVFLENFSIRK